jgi:hypothetical protein
MWAFGVLNINKIALDLYKQEFVYYSNIKFKGLLNYERFNGRTITRKL